MIPMRAKEIPTILFPLFETQSSGRRERSDRQAVHTCWLRPQRRSLAEHIEQALLEAERLHGD